MRFIIISNQTQNPNLTTKKDETQKHEHTKPTTHNEVDDELNPHNPKSKLKLENHTWNREEKKKSDIEKWRQS